jgi:cell division septal protein FtsQ
MSAIGRRRRRLFATVALAALIVAVPVAVYTWGRESGTFQVRHVVIHGQRSAHTRALRAVLRRRFLGANLFLVSAARVRAALAGFPYVDQVQIDRDFPDTLRIRMTEYVPAALLLSAGQWYVVASGGRVLAQATSTAANGTSPAGSPSAGASPEVSASSGTTFSPTANVSPTANASPTTNATPVAGGTTTGASAGTSSPSPSASPTTLPQPGAGVGLPRGARHLPVVVSSAPVSVGTTVADPHVRQALAVLAALPAALRRTALGARATDTSIIVYESGGLRVEFGDGSELAAKALSLRAVLSRYRAHRVTCTYVDVSVPDRPLGAPLLPAPATQTGTTAGTPSYTPGATPKSTPSGSPSATKSATPGGAAKPTGTPTTTP